MSLQFKIQNTLGIERAEISCAPLALLTGVNGAGKSSTIAACAAALTGQVMPGSIPKKDGKVIVRDGSDIGRVVAATEGGRSYISWPDAEMQHEGTAPAASPVAAGLYSLLDHDPRGRAQLLDQILKASPSKADLAQALKDSDGRFISGGGAATAQEAEAMAQFNLDPVEQRDAAIYRIVEKIWPEIEVNGFDGAHAKAKDRGAELKGAWRQISGEAYGADKAAKWQPKDMVLVEEMLPENKEAVSYFTETAERFKSFVETTIKNAAICAADLDGTREKAGQLPELESLLAKANKVLDVAREDNQAWIKKATPVIPAEPMACPHCAAAVAIEDGKLVAASHAPTAKEIEIARAALREHEAGKAAAKLVFDTAYDEVKAIEGRIRDAKTAAHKLAEGSAAAVPETSEEDVVKAKMTLDKHERALAASRQKAEADKIHRQVQTNQAIIDALAPEGVRKAKLVKVLDSFNEAMLAPLCAAAGWAPVTIGPDMEIRFGGRLAREPFISESQVMRVRIVLQLVMARLDRSACVLIDRADKLDPKGRNGLFALLRHVGIPAVLAMTFGRKELETGRIPDLSAAGMGQTYWIEAGRTVPLADMVAQLKQAAE